MPLDFDSDLLRTFVVIADAGGFTRAAQVVHRTQSAVSMQMKRLEETVGRALFERDGRSVVLTPDGETLLRYARRILKLHQEAAASLTQPEMSGVVRLGCPDDYVQRFLPGVLARFAQCYPLIQVEVHCEPSNRLEQYLEQGELDLALTSCRLDVSNSQVLRQEPVIWATSGRHFAHEADPLPLALFQKGCFFRAWALQTLDNLGKDYRIAYVSPSIAGIQAAVSAGLAVTVISRSILPPGVRELTAEEGFPPLPVAAITLRRSDKSENPAVVECLASYLKEGFQNKQGDLFRAGLLAGATS